MCPERIVADDPRQSRPCDIFDDRLLRHQVEPNFALECLQISVFMEVFDIASNVVQLTHQVMMGRPDEQLRPALELPLCLPDSGQDQPVDAAAILVDPVKRLSDRSRPDVYVQRPQLNRRVISPAP